ncbi:hypothetical protein KP509_29G000600 [Ceratopteris richardii]|uniref:Protein kinase domain-containing protein n=2 Tax=Ceratopteris richardii TaxID=49495 RepID=A0A8T2R3Z1_CERRI|nr:hypothetical protein KP509_29G000600 [Ceratopteris richardii]
MSLRLQSPFASGEHRNSANDRVLRASRPFRSTFLHSSTLSFTCNPNSTLTHRKYHIRNALPEVSDSLYSYVHDSLGLNADIIWLQSAVLQSAHAIGLSLQDPMSWWQAAIAPAVLSVFFAPPGSLAGVADFVYAPIHAHTLRHFSAEDVEIGRQLGEGSFGVVYEGFIGRGKKGHNLKGLHVVLKKAKTRVKGASEIHNSEIHMNYRLQRTAPFACAEFLGTMHVKPSHANGKLSEGVWLVWNFQGDRSLDYYLKQKSFPANLIPIILGKNVQGSSKEEILRCNAAVIKEIFKQILMNLQDLHGSGVVHRDVKPLNLILDQGSGRFKLIDFGACVDLRSGFNYVPNETVIDPTYAAPEHYVMPTSTPNLPPDPLCSLVSPLLWLLNTPDRFDLYSAGLILMQLSLKSLRHDTGLQTFNSELKRNGFNLKRWRANCRHSNDEFMFLDADGGAGWELASALLQPRHDKDNIIWPSLGSSRPSASAALKHRFLHRPFTFPVIFRRELPDSILKSLPDFNVVSQSISGAVMEVVHSGKKQLDKSALEQSHGAKISTKSFLSRLIPSSYLIQNDFLHVKLSNALKDNRRKVVENIDYNLWSPHLNMDPLYDFKSFPLTSAVQTKFDKAVQSILNGSPVRIQRNEPNSTTLPLVSDAQTPRQPEKIPDLGADMNNSVSSSIQTALPVLASTGIALATGWLALSGLTSSAQASYEFGKLLMSTSGISGSAFFAFFLMVKPWLEEHNTTTKKVKDYNSESMDGQAASPKSGEIQQGKYKAIYSERSQLQAVVGAMQELDTHMSVLEALMLEEQQLSQQQEELVQRLESLLLQPSER